MNFAAGITDEPLEQGTSLWRDAWHRLAQNKLAIAGAIVLLLLTLGSLLGPLVLPQSYETQDLQLGATPPARNIGWGRTHLDATCSCACSTAVAFRLRSAS